MLNILYTTLFPSFYPVILQNYSCKHVVVVVSIRVENSVDPG